jgi:hypothetical protein
MEVSGNFHVPAALPAGKQHLVFMALEAGWARAGIVVVKKWKISKPCWESKFESIAFQPVV